ncbi:protein S100-A7-like [Anolis sagrei]|uniref:protein S100-A7-like n=1 Tax=Anolis sagrei TaxID=38937 RepID=UPI0035211D35
MSSAHAHSHDKEKPKPGSAMGSCTMDKSCETIVQVFHRYSMRDGKDDNLSFRDLKQFLQDQLPTFLAACGRSRPQYLEELFTKMDVNKDKVLSFEETARIVALAVDDFHRISHNEDRCGPDRD